MKYFSVEKEYIVGNIYRYEVAPDGTRAGDLYEVDCDEDTPSKIITGLLVNEYEENGTIFNTKFYAVKSDTGTAPQKDDTGDYVYASDEAEVLAKIAEDHPASDWQNNNW